MVNTCLPENVLKIVWKFFDKSRSVLMRSEANLKLAASLYVAKRIKEETHTFGWKNLQLSFSAVSDDCFRKVTNLLGKYIVEIGDYIEEEELEVLLSNYTAVMDFCLDLYHQSILTEMGMLTQPYELTEFCCRLLEIEHDAVVYNPFGGLATFATANPYCRFVGEELNPTAWAFMQIRLDAHGNGAQYKNGDSFDGLEDSSRKYKYVIANPPYGIKGTKYNEFDVIKLAMENKLVEDGILLLVLPLSFCFGLKQKSIREYLLNNGYLSMVITLPNIFAPIVQVNTCIVIAQKAKQKGFVLVDGSKSIVNTEKVQCKLAYKALLESIENMDEKICTNLMTCEQLDENLDLSPTRMLYKLPSIETPTKLRNLIQLLPKVRSNGSYWNCDFRDTEWIKPNIVVKHKVGGNTLSCVKYDGDFLITYISKGTPKTGKITGNVPIGDYVSVHPNWIAFRIKNNDLISEAYLRHELESEYVIDQIRACSSGNIMPKISTEDFLDITISLPPISDQERIVNERMGKIMEQVGVTNTFSDLAHMLGTPFSKISTALAMLKQSSALSESDLTVIKYLSANFKYVDRIVKANTAVDFHKAPKKPVCLFSFLEEYVATWGLIGSNTFKVSLDAAPNAKHAMVVANEDNLMIMFDCLFENANRHGFHKTASEDNEVSVVLHDVVQEGKVYINMLVGNNGCPMPKDFTLSDYVTKGKFVSGSGRTGLGGYHVNEIVSSMDGELKNILSTPEWTRFDFFIPVIE